MVIKEAAAEWLESMFKYISDNPQLIMNGFVCTGITSALDGKDPDNEPLPEATTEDSDIDEEDNTIIDYISIHGYYQTL